jgi:hypothetical protein
MIPQDDSQDVAAWMEEFARTPLDAPPLADPSLLWWKAQLLRRWDAERRVTEPIEVGERVQVGIGVVGTLLILGWLWRILPTTSRGPSMAVVIAVSSILLTVAVLFASWGRGSTRTRSN